MIDYIKNMLLKFCKNDETCLFIILALFGFLLCMVLNRKEGFLDYASIDDLDKEENHNYGGDIGQPPSKLGNNPGQNAPLNGYGPIEKKLGIAVQGKQYNSRNINQDGKIHVSQVGLPLAYDWGKSGGYYLVDGQPSSFGPDRPLDSKGGEFNVMGNNKMDSRAVVTSSDNKELELVLFYAPWCGHSKNMLEDYDYVIDTHNNQVMNDVKLKIVKIDMDQNKEAAKEYNVKVKGFPTLYTFTKVKGEKLGKLFNFRKKDEIISELEKRTSSL
jgi:thiol-disulfide isomerase/thioredoxin